MTVLAPGDPVEAACATRAAASGMGPVYLRLGRDKEPVVHPGPIQWSVGKAITVRQGRDVTLISTGAMLASTVAAAGKLAESRIDARVLSMHTVKPLDAEAVLAAARETGKIVTIEEHSLLGGLGGSVAEVLCESDLPNVRFRRIGLPSKFLKAVGDQDYLRKVQGLDVPAFCRRVQELF